MRTHKDISEINLAKDYTEHLWDIGETFLQSFKKRSQTLPLHIQIVCGINGWDTILKSKPYLANAHDDYGRVPLMVYYHTFIYEKLLKYGADPNAKDLNGNTVLMYHRNNPELVEEFVRAGADINATNNAGESLVSMALKEGRPIYPFVKLGASLPSVDRSVIDRSFFLGCLQREPVDILSRLFSDSFPSENTFLHAKIWSGCFDQNKFKWVKSLGKHYSKQRKAAFSTDEEEIFTKALNSRVCGGDFNHFDELIANMDECLTGRDSIHACIRKDKTILSGVSNFAILDFLLKAGADPNLGKVWKENPDEDTPLYRAVSRHDKQAVKLLLAHGANPDTGTSYMDADDTCVTCSIRENDLDILQMLIDAKADLNFAIRDTKSPVVVAITSDNLQALKMLVDGGAKAYPLNVSTSFYYHHILPEICEFYNSVVGKEILPIIKGK